MFVLGIETSCDETAGSILKGGDKILSSVVSSSIAFHERFGGVVPEIASRFHVEYINYVVRKALDDAAGEAFDKIYDGRGIRFESYCTTRFGNIIIE